jgi:hypothetical protein
MMQQNTFISQQLHPADWGSTGRTVNGPHVAGNRLLRFLSGKNLHYELSHSCPGHGRDFSVHRRRQKNHVRQK